MTRRITTPSRLHFGLLGWGDEAPRQFGSVGLMVNAPGLTIEAEPSEQWLAEGPLADRVMTLARSLIQTLRVEGVGVPPLNFHVRSAPPEHVGLGTGTQLSLAVARLILAESGHQEPDVERLAALTGRGRRSGIGLHGFQRGGLIVDGGHSSRSILPPLLSRLEFPADWKVLLVVPSQGLLMSGSRERDAFARLPCPPPRTTDRLCRLILLELLPAVAERDLAQFGESLGRIQHEVGTCFATAQGGRFAGDHLEETASWMSELGLVGVGQSSWGPTLYGFTDADPIERARILDGLHRRLRSSTDLLIWTEAASRGVLLTSLQ